MNTRFTQKAHHSTITMSLAIIVLGFIILPWSDYRSNAFIPLVLSMIISFIILTCAILSLRRKREK